MVSHEAINSAPYDHNAAVAAAGEEQARVNAERELHDKYGLDPRGKLGLYAARDIRDAFERLIATLQPLPQDTGVSTVEPSPPSKSPSTSLPDAQQ